MKAKHLNLPPILLVRLEKYLDGQWRKLGQFLWKVRAMLINHPSSRFSFTVVLSFVQGSKSKSKSSPIANQTITSFPYSHVYLCIYYYYPPFHSMQRIVLLSFLCPYFISLLLAFFTLRDFCGNNNNNKFLGKGAISECTLGVQNNVPFNKEF